MHPYIAFPSRAFWSRAVSNDFEPEALLAPGPPLVKKGELVASAGSCFAANLVPYLEAKGLSYLRTETRHPALRRIPEENLGYDRFSAAYGNIYTTRQLLQLFRRSQGAFTPVEDRWFTRAGVIDPFRPGLKYHATSEREFELLQKQHIACVRRVFERADVFIFTLGLTEAWFSRADGAVFPACPGTVADEYDAERHGFVNFETHDVANDLRLFVDELRVVNPRVRVILTVSPVPLIATASGEHVLVATTYSKAVLRVAAREVALSRPDVVYFPAFEIVTGPQAGGDFFEADRRNVSTRAVDTVMAAFLAHCDVGLDAATPDTTASNVTPDAGPADPARKKAANAEPNENLSELAQRIADAECEEALADA